MALLLNHSKFNSLKEEIIAIKSQEADLLEEISKHQKDNKIYYFNTPKMPANPLQKELIKVWVDPSYDIFTYTGANQIGKTATIIIMALCTMFGEFPWDGTRLKFSHNNPRKIRIIGHKWLTHLKDVIVDGLYEWWPKDRELLTPKKNNEGVEYLWNDKKTGSTITLMSATNMVDPKTHAGWKGDAVFVDEPVSRPIYVENRRGLITRGGKMMLGMTLVSEAWIHQDIIKKKNDDGTASRRVWNVNGDIFSNAGFGITKENAQKYIDDLSEKEKEARAWGKPSYLSGLVYPEFNRDRNLKKLPKEIPLSWILDVAIDYHPAKPWAILFMVTTNGGFKFVIHEISEKGSWEYIGNKIIRKILELKLDVANIIIDPLAKGDPNSDRNMITTFGKLELLFGGYDLPLTTAIKDKENGIIMVRSLLWTINEVVGLYFADHLPLILKEMEGLNFDEKTGKVSKKDDDMTENLYRLILLGTEWEPREEIDDEAKADRIYNQNNKLRKRKGGGY